MIKIKAYLSDFSKNFRKWTKSLIDERTSIVDKVILKNCKKQNKMEVSKGNIASSMVNFPNDE